MKQFETTLSDQGRITVPAAVRAALRMKPGDRLIFERDEAGKVYIRVKERLVADHAGPSGDLARLPGLLDAALAQMIKPTSDGPAGDFLMAEDERTKSGR